MSNRAPRDFSGRERASRAGPSMPEGEASAHGEIFDRRCCSGVARMRAICPGEGAQAHRLAVGAVRRDERDEGDDPRIGEELGDLPCGGSWRSARGGREVRFRCARDEGEAAGRPGWRQQGGGRERGCGAHRCGGCSPCGRRR